MILHTLPTYPQSRAYVLQLHRDAGAPGGALLGRIVHIASGETSEFASAGALLEWLATQLAAEPGTRAA
jgi:hypothetical protein